MSIATKGVRDVTEEFMAAAKQLPPGYLVKDEYFTLFEAVGALEIMDPKMDSGYVPPDDTFEPELDVCRGLEAEEVIWILDQIMCLEIAWHEGYPLSQTVFTSLHIDHLLSPENGMPYKFIIDATEDVSSGVQHHLTHNVLRACCIAVVKCCQFVLFAVQSQHFYEEEDFVTHLFGRELMPYFGSNDALKLLDHAIDWINSSGLSHDVQEALSQRLLFRRTLLATLSEDENNWSHLPLILEALNRTHRVARPLPEAFSEKVQRKLATSTPPRPMLQLSWDYSYKKWHKMCEDVLAAEKLTSFWICQNPNYLQNAAWAFSYRDPQPGPFPQAYFQNAIFGNDKITEDVSFFDLLLTDFRDLVLAGDPLADPESFQIEVTSDLRHRCSRHIEAFMDKIFDEYLNLYRMVCQNRCRIRRSFTQATSIWDGMEAEARRTENELEILVQTSTANRTLSDPLHLKPLSNWVKFHKLRIAAWTIQLGFETDIYLPDEISSMYWLLNSLCEARGTVLAHIEVCLVNRMKNLTPSTSAKYAVECLASQDWLRCLSNFTHATRLMSLALWKLYSLLLTLKIIRPPKREYAQDQLLYEARMKPYLGIVHDHIPSLADFQRAQKNLSSLDSTCKAIEMDIKQAKDCISELKRVTPEQGKYVGTEEQWNKEMKQLETTCVAIFVQTSQLTRFIEKFGRKSNISLEGSVEVVIPLPGKRYHDWWIVPQIKAKQR
ncbi:hypothetical protein M433DRAFT_73094 [Acidomyces richmondensis BFW]|nr:MAG: hypothetical protein FE78DRAFT_135944 [Acidomyces sp. 'richmondensis']KYG42772.1 hypothetical protein M433DRAFT_73094 [Acidomyces richmondensis BFW]